MGMKVVTGGGEILDLNQGLIKNATGYDFRQLFIGSEGTLGIVTEATLALCAPPKNPKVLLLGLEDLAAVMKVYEHFKLHSSLLAFELFTAAALELVQAHSHLAFPLKNQSGYFLVVEFESSSPAVGSTPENESAEDADLQLFSTLFECGWVVDGAMAQNEKQAREFWRFREDISESAAPYQPYKNDISVRISCVPEFLTEVQQLLTKEYPEFRVVWFGHIGDGNLHINVLKPADMPAADFTRHCARVNDLLFASVAHFHGSVSAEHGIGLMKKPYLHFSRSQEEIQIMRQIKNIFDPDSILNPGKLFDP